MRIKSYFVKSVDDAIARARTDLGEDALLLNSRKCVGEGGSGEQYEVTFGSAGDVASDLPPANQPEPSRHHDSAELQSLRAELNELRRMLLAEGQTKRPPELETVFANLTAVGFDPILAGQIVDSVDERMKAGGPSKPKRSMPIGWKVRRFGWETFVSALRTELGARIPVDARLGAQGRETAVVLVGPGGAGKTATIMKIAALQAGPDRPLRLFTLDPELASRMKLQFFARKMGVSFTVIEKLEGLPEILDEARKREIVLVDTPSCATAAEREVTAAVLAKCSGLDVHLVAPGYMSVLAFQQCIARYRVFRPTKLIVSKLDESGAFGGIVSEAAQTGLSISLVTDGVAIPGNLHAFSVDDLVGIALGERAAAVCA